MVQNEVPKRPILFKFFGQAWHGFTTYSQESLVSCWSTPKFRTPTLQHSQSLRHHLAALFTASSPTRCLRPSPACLDITLTLRELQVLLLQVPLERWWLVPILSSVTGVTTCQHQVAAIAWISPIDRIPYFANHSRLKCHKMNCHIALHPANFPEEKSFQSENPAKAEKWKFKWNTHMN